MNTDLTIFYADDDSEDLDFFKDITDSIQGVTLYTHTRGDALIDALQNPPPSPQIIFLDLNMPGKTGFDVLSELKANQTLKDIPVVIFSTSNDERTVAKSLELGASFYLPKLESFREYRKSIEFALAIDWKTFKPTPQNFFYTAA